MRFSPKAVDVDETVEQMWVTDALVLLVHLPVGDDAPEKLRVGRAGPTLKVRLDLDLELLSCWWVKDKDVYVLRMTQR